MGYIANEEEQCNSPGTNETSEWLLIGICSARLLSALLSWMRIHNCVAIWLCGILVWGVPRCSNDVPKDRGQQVEV